MTTENIHPDDPRLTAYVLGELDATEQAEIEALISGNPDALTAVAELRETVGLVNAALAREPVSALSATQRLAISSAAGPSTDGRRSTGTPAAGAQRFRGRYVVLATCVSAAAAVALAVILPTLPNPESSEATSFSPSQARSTAEEKLVAAREVRATALGDEWRRSSEAQDFLDEAASEQMLPAPEGQRLAVRSPFGSSKAPVPVSGPMTGAGGYGLPTHEAGQVSAPQTQPAQVRGWAYSVENEFGANASGLARPNTVPWGARATTAPSTGAGGAAEFARPGEAASDSRVQGLPAGGPEPADPRLIRRSAAPALNLSETGEGVVSSTAKPPAVDSYAARSVEVAPGGVPGSQAPSNSPVDASPETSALGLVPQGEFNTADEAYNPILENDFITPTGQAALSTFSIDVDTASYSNIRRFLTHGQFPPPDAVRIEELLNYFRYDYPQPEGDTPFSVTTEIGVCPWNSDHRLARIGLKGREISREQRPPSNLVFLIDVSGSMRDANKLPLVQQGLEMLVGEMTEDDRVAIVTYAGEAGVKLPSTSGDRRDDILSVIRGLSAGGSTNGEAGIHLAYTEAIRHHIKDGTNRVILCSDGDFNVGVSDDNELVRLIQDKARQSRVFLSIFGFGMGNLKDAKLEQLANKGNGQYAYVDNPREARKVFVEEMAGSLYTIAKDVKIQVEFNPARVGAYRLIGYENRALAARDFQDDTKDAGEIGAGHTVTALYEIVPADKLPPAGGEPLKYQQKPAAPAAADASPETLTLKLRYKQPNEDTSTLLEFPVMDDVSRGTSPSRDFDWAASVAAFGLVLRNSAHKGQADLDLVRELALGARGPDASGLRREFIDLVHTAQSLRARQLGQPVPAPPQEQP